MMSGKEERSRERDEKVETVRYYPTAPYFAA